MLKSQSDFSKIYLVTEISRLDSIIFYDTYPVLGSVSKRNVWTAVSVIFRCNANIKKDDRIRAYLFANNNLVLIDDLEAEVVFAKNLAVL